jgi:alkylation response protein AidB-like acyl-CoA dehydrogenase
MTLAETEPVAGAAGLTPAQAELQARARAFVEEVLIPLEVPAERAGGRLPAADVERIRAEALARRLAGGSHAAAHGGQGWSTVEWFLVEEQFGRSTNALSWHIPSAYNVLAAGSPAQPLAPTSPRPPGSPRPPARRCSRTALPSSSSTP